jgi:hypothetical protein
VCVFWSEKSVREQGLGFWSGNFDYIKLDYVYVPLPAAEVRN